MPCVSAFLAWSVSYFLAMASPTVAGASPLSLLLLAPEAGASPPSMVSKFDMADLDGSAAAPCCCCGGGGAGGAAAPPPAAASICRCSSSCHCVCSCTCPRMRILSTCFKNRIVGRLVMGQIWSSRRASLMPTMAWPEASPACSAMLPFSTSVTVIAWPLPKGKISKHTLWKRDSVGSHKLLTSPDDGEPVACVSLLSTFAFGLRWINLLDANGFLCKGCAPTGNLLLIICAWYNIAKWQCEAAFCE
mmetsp:Transcript_24080/g.65915  ORF Transcript_24080/g.65915 Transcript_24080/m.65915 type:complete len:247 (-) Transcript_24080:1215-1955(-)